MTNDSSLQRRGVLQQSANISIEYDSAGRAPVLPLPLPSFFELLDTCGQVSICSLNDSIPTSLDIFPCCPLVPAALINLWCCRWHRTGRSCCMRSHTSSSWRWEIGSIADVLVVRVRHGSSELANPTRLWKKHSRKRRLARCFRCEIGVRVELWLQCAALSTRRNDAGGPKTWVDCQGCHWPFLDRDLCELSSSTN